MSCQIEISLGQQRLILRSGADIVAEYAVSTALNGPGEKMHSECTPRGRHRIAEMIGEGAEPDTVFVGRKPTGEVFSADLRTCNPGRDWILTRILRLEGIEEGINRGGDVDTFARLIYIHGSPDDVEMGIPGSHGCIRMRNADVMDLYEKVGCGTEVLITD